MNFKSKTNSFDVMTFNGSNFEINAINVDYAYNWSFKPFLYDLAFRVEESNKAQGRVGLIAKRPGGPKTYFKYASISEKNGAIDKINFTESAEQNITLELNLLKNISFEHKMNGVFMVNFTHVLVIFELNSTIEYCFVEEVTKLLPKFLCFNCFSFV